VHILTNFKSVKTYPLAACITKKRTVMLFTDLKNNTEQDTSFLKHASLWGPEDEDDEDDELDEEDESFDDTSGDLDDLHEVEEEDEELGELPPDDDDDHLPEEEE
jgi:hypothetical protein